MATDILEGLYPGRSVTGIDVRNLYPSAGMVHGVNKNNHSVSRVTAPSPE